MDKATVGYKIFRMANILLMLLVALVCLLPYVHILAKAFNEGLDTSLGGIYLWPRAWTTENFIAILARPFLFRSAFISGLRVVTGTLLSVIVVFTAAYSMNRRSFPGRKPILLFLMVPMFFSGGLIPTYIAYARIGMLNNFLVYVLPTAFSFFHMLLARTYMQANIPVSLEESAKLDGASEALIFRRVYLPLSAPILATITLWTAVYHWNDWITTLYYAQTNTDIFPLQYQLMRMLRERELLQDLMEENARRGVLTSLAQNTTSESLKNAQIIITILPIVLVYPFLQKHFIKGVMVGSIKE